MIVTVTQEDFDNAGPYYDNHNCLMATALKRYFPGKEIRVLPFCCSVGEEEYHWGEQEESKIQDSYWKTNFPFNVRLAKHEM